MIQNNYTCALKSKDIFKTFSSSKVMWETGKPAYTLYNTRLISENLSLFEKADIKSFMNLLNNKSDFFEILNCSNSKFPESEKYIFQRLKDLNTMLDTEENEQMSLESLKGLLVFLYSIKSFRKPTITLNDLGYLQLNWKKDKNNLLTLNFKENHLLHYVIFMPSHYTSKRIILNGAMNILDFKHYLSKLGLKLHKESK
ncbi:MAG: hypothetical protein GY795_13710 [Desulfobacterales bacterium]|nr:hypothetical protein [Desulfobacterales bacterium]